MEDWWWCQLDKVLSVDSVALDDEVASSDVDPLEMISLVLSVEHCSVVVFEDELGQ